MPLTHPSLAPLELGETRFKSIVRRHEGPVDTLVQLISDAAWNGCDPRLPGLNSDDAQILLNEPHVLGWLHQFLQEDSRTSSFQNHTQDEQKHANNFVSTQLYTPRWVADFLTQRAFDLSGVCVALDPACGGGQMLLAWIDRLLDAGVEPSDAFGMVRGLDLDPAAVKACRSGLKLHAFRVLGERDEVLEEIIDTAITCDDSLRTSITPCRVVITNPPYMGSRSMPSELKSFIHERYKPFHLDLYSAFIARCHELSTHVVAILAQQTIWYVGRYEPARIALLEMAHLDTFAHLGPHVFRALTGEKANVVAFVQSKTDLPKPCEFWDLRQLRVQDKRLALANPGAQRDVDELCAIPGSPLAFWLPHALAEKFTSFRSLGEFAQIPGSQNKTGNNANFLRRAAELAPQDIKPATGLPSGNDPEARWAYYSKGGKFAPWWGNWDWVVDWSNEAQTFYKKNPTSNLLAPQYRFRPGLCYSDFGGQRFAARWLPAGCLFDMAGPAIFHPDNDEARLHAWMVILNSSAARALLNALNPSIHYQVRDVRRLPIPAISPSEWNDLATLGFNLRETTQRAIEGSRDAASELVAMEWRAEERVAALYGCPPQPPPTHSALKNFFAPNPRSSYSP